MKALFVGLGSIGQRHLRNLRTIVGESLEASAWRVTKTVPLLDGKGNAELGVDLAHHYQILEFERLRDALENKPNIVFVCNPNSLHVEVAQAAIDAGCDVFIEKPVSHSAAGIARLIQSANATSRIVAVGFQYRFHPGIQQAKLWLNENRIGQFASASFINGEYIPGLAPMRTTVLPTALVPTLAEGLWFRKFMKSIWRTIFLGCQNGFMRLATDIRDWNSMLKIALRYCCAL